MSFDEYAQHIYQKHRLIVAVAIIKSKPSELTALEYLNQLKSKMADNMADNMDDNMADEDATVCSDDFIMDYDEDNDSITVLSDFGDEGSLVNEGRSEGIQGNSGNAQVLNQQHTNYSQNTFYNIPQDISINTHQNIADTTTSQFTPLNYFDRNNVTHYDINLKENEPNNNTSNEKHYNVANLSEKQELVIKRDAVPNKINREETNTKISLNNRVDNLNNNEFLNTNTHLTNTDSQKTILYTVHGYTQNYTHYSPSQTDIFVPKTHLYGDKTNIVNTTQKNIGKSENLAMLDNNKSNIDRNTNRIPEKDDIYDKTAMPSNTNDTIAKNNTVFKDPVPTEIPTNIEFKNNTIFEDAVPTEMSTNIEFENIQTALYSQEFDNILNQYTTEASNAKTHENEQILDNIFIEIPSQDQSNLNVTPFNIKINKENNNYSQNKSHLFENNNNKSKITNFESNQTLDHHSNNKENNNNSQNNSHFFENNNNTNYESNQRFDHEKDKTQSQNFKIQSQDFGPNYETSQNIPKEDFYSPGEEEDLVEVIPYKVLEELNKVKSFLRRKERRVSSDSYSSDSGYRSDSQIRSSNRSGLQLSGISINQSAYCLFNHLMVSPLINATRDITTEIAQTLSELINKLHEEESYPPFLEELLNTVDILLRQVYKGQNIDDLEFLKKEEFIQRILLLNKSVHIQEHTIEKITNLLSNFHQKITEKNVTYELINVNEIENLSYIFHLLEILIKKYVQIKDVRHGNTELSQDDERILKRSSITDIWRKKWNPDLKIIEGSRENRCVLKNCSEILNKLVVECVSSYSLVAFSALKCFNCIQS